MGKPPRFETTERDPCLGPGIDYSPWDGIIIGKEENPKVEDRIR